MREEDHNKFGQLMFMVMAEYEREFTRQSLTLWTNALRDYEYDAIHKALDSWIRNPDEGKFAPKIGDVIRMIEGTTGDKAMEAWTKVDRAVRRIGNYQSVAFDDPIIHRVVDDMGGWIYLCSVPTDKDLEFRGHEFVKRYRTLALRREPLESYPRYLIGEAEAVNGSRGFTGYDGLHLIGNQEAAREVVQGGSDSQRIGISGEVDKADVMGTVKRLGNNSGNNLRPD